MVISGAFQTRARTIDHLGREQIADCPTAISELWKNAYDAYAHNVSLNIFDGELPVASLVDDGHGMTLQDVQNKWLTVGTESKAILSDTPKSDRNGIEEPRVKQGQKGIGRLSCAALGYFMLLVSKKKNSNFVACLLDWRLFENPYLMLNDIKIPIVEFENKNELLYLISDLYDSLLSNIIGDESDIHRTQRIISAWEAYTSLEASQQNMNIEDFINKKMSSKQLIMRFFKDKIFIEKHFESWSVWNGSSQHGTGMFIAGIHDDLAAQLNIENGSDGEGPEIRAKERFKQTLNCFVNPFKRSDENMITDFKTSVITWHGTLQRAIVDEVRNFDISNFDQLEHIIEGTVDSTGLFIGRVKAFGEWHEDVKINPKSNYKMRSDSIFGPFKIRTGTFEVSRKSSSLTDEQHSSFISLREIFGGVMVFRDDLRVMPYGREDNDFFEIEKRRSKNAGMYVFSNRSSFGGVFISKEKNPNLRDKAGREGIIDNKASKIFREVFENILVVVANKFLGRYSSLREIKINEIQAQHAAEKSDKDRKKLLRSELKRVRNAIIKNSPVLSQITLELDDISLYLRSEMSKPSQDIILGLKKDLDRLDAELRSLSLSPIPRSLGSLEQDYRIYRDIENNAKKMIFSINSSVNEALEKLLVRDDADIAERDLRSKAGILHAKIRKLSNAGRSSLRDEMNRFEEIITSSNKAFHMQLTTCLSDLTEKKITLNHALKKIDEEYELQNILIDQKIKPYITALSNLREEIDLETLAISSVNENIELKNQIEQINSLAQLGITVEIIGHEIEGFDLTIDRGIRKLADSDLNSSQKDYLSSIRYAHQSLSDSWRFLSPLKLSGEKVRTIVNGIDIYEYVNAFFGKKFENDQIIFKISDSFKKFSVYEQPARIYPVFINLINNARYWVRQTKELERVIEISCKDNIVYISDNGPGVDNDDINNLFTLFFSKKQRGGRGVGLYLCKQNLAIGGHDIFYETNEKNKKLAGANFAIAFKGL